MRRIQYKNYLLLILLFAGVVSIFDRFVFALALEPIKVDLHLSDTQLGLMTGIAFAAFYALAGIPIARWADRGNRITIAAVTMGLLGVMLAFCGVVTNFIQLLLARAGVAVGEAGCMPTAQSLLADYFDRAERPQAMAIYFMFYPISMIAGYLVGGWLVDGFGWRTTFLILGVPGVIAAILIKLTLKEPRLIRPKETTVEPPNLTDVSKILWGKMTFRHLITAFCVAYFFQMGTSQWLAAFFMRNHGMGAAELGAWLALSWGVFGAMGNYMGGYLATRYAARKEKLQLRGLAVVVVLGGVANAVTYLSPSQNIALVFVAAGAFFGSLANGPVFSIIQGLVNENMRSVTLAIIFMFANLIGFGFGPLAIGFVSDLLSSTFEQDSLRYALALSTPGVFWIAYHFWKAGDTVEEDIRLEELAKPITQNNNNLHHKTPKSCSGAI